MEDTAADAPDAAVWQELGLELTTDAASIRRAYAARLRGTRPDDDAGAYQRLREAYELALQWACRCATAASPDDAAPPPTPQGAGVDEPTPAAPEHDAPQTDWAALGAELRAAIAAVPHDATAAQAREHGQRIEHILGAVPLDERPPVSLFLARLVVERRDLPTAFVQALLDHFGWLADYRHEAALGPELAQALRFELAARTELPAVHPELLAQLRLLRQPARWRSRLHVLLTGHRLERSLDMLPPAMLAHVGVDAQQAVRLLARLVHVHVAWWALAATALVITSGLVVGVRVALLAGLAVMAMLYAASAAALPALSRGLVRAHRLVLGNRLAHAGPPWLGAVLQRLPLAGAAGPVLAAILLAGGTDPGSGATAVAAAAGAAGVVLAWSVTVPLGAVMLAVIAWTTLLPAAAADVSLPTLLWLAAWSLLCMAAWSRLRTGAAARPAAVALGTAAAGLALWKQLVLLSGLPGWLAAIAYASLLALPVLALALAERRSPRLVGAALFLPPAAYFMNLLPLHQPLAWTALPLCLVGLAAAERAALAVAARLAGPDTPLDAAPAVTPHGNG